MNSRKFIEISVDRWASFLLVLRISEWNSLINLLPLIMSFDLDLPAVCPWSMREDHLNDPNIVLGCRECSPSPDNARRFHRPPECTFRRNGARKTARTSKLIASRVELAILIQLSDIFLPIFIANICTVWFKNLMRMLWLTIWMNALNLMLLELEQIINELWRWLKDRL